VAVKSLVKIGQFRCPKWPQRPSSTKTQCGTMSLLARKKITNFFPAQEITMIFSLNLLQLMITLQRINFIKIYCFLKSFLIILPSIMARCPKWVRSPLLQSDQISQSDFIENFLNVLHINPKK
jgi:hypothetical protein